MVNGLPPVTAGAAGEAAELLPGRLRKRLDGAVGKAGGWVVRAGDGEVVVAVDAETTVTLTLSPAGTVATAGAVRCDCLLAPACLHRAAVLAAAPLADEEEEEEGDGPGEEGSDARSKAAGETGERPADPDPDSPAGGPASDAMREAAAALWTAGVTALCAGANASALPRTALLHAAHSARLARLHRPAASATRVARRLGEARAADSAFRLGELVADLAALLAEARAVAAGDAALAGAARRTYQPAGPLRLYGLFTEPVVTASGYGGAVTHLATAEGEVRTVGVVAPGGVERVDASAGAGVPGGAALTLRQLGRGGGLIATGATVTEDGRIGGGAGLRTVGAGGAGWFEPPLDALWRRPAAAQVAAAVARPEGDGLLFLSGTVTRLDGLPALALAGGGPVVVLHAPDARPELAYTANLRRLAGLSGAAVRLIGRLAPDRPRGVVALALGTPDRTVDLGLDQLPAALATAAAGPAAPPSGSPLPLPLPLPPVEWDLLSRTVARTVAGGRAVAAVAADPALPGRLRAAGLPTAAACAAALSAAARARRPDALGAMLPADPDAFATAWLAAAVYLSAAARDFTTAAWAGG
ncbi:hypothetical protein OG552_11200 [Streptomyces sp. NBC_01476]|uniref:hypothetical protein n=1 Tax=Streptomyces sp. NBC_01476 TaxID=2903881 RepID=UPI002E330D68|nr:hypothetical protein [Streptomyces sp. NBC_01476]